jgi:MFS family permease
MAPQGLGMLVSLPRVGKLVDRFDPGRIVVAGVLATIAGTLVFALAPERAFTLLGVSLFVRGIGLGAMTLPALTAAYRSLGADEIPNATTALSLVQRLGAPLGTAVMAVALHRFMIGAPASSSHPALVAAFAHTFALSLALTAITLLAALVLLRPSTPRTEP